MKVSFYTLGCRVNQYETEMMRGRFEALGYETVAEGEWADVYIINTCTVTSMADRKSRQFIRRMKRVNPEAFVCVTGCYAQVSAEEVAAVIGVNLVVGTSDKGEIARLVDERINGGCEKRGLSDGEHGEVLVRPHGQGEEYVETGVVASMEGRTRAYVKVQEGCNRFCSYCEIPFARGVVRSRQPMDVLEEASSLLKRGFREIVLTGINTALYGTEDYFKPEFPAGYEKYAALWKESCDESGVCKYGTGLGLILAMINDLPGDFRIRIGSLEPTVVNKSDLGSILGYEKLCHHLHLSIQSGSDNVLKSMNRNYVRADYLEITKALFEFDPHFGISTDIIAGFPGESDDDFRDSIDIEENVDFCKVHAFDYSRRAGTVADRMPGQLDPAVKKSRVRELIEAGDESQQRFFLSCIGDRRRVLVEDYDAKSGLYSGYTDNYIRTYFAAAEGDLDGRLCGEFIDVTMVEPFGDGMKAL